MQELVLLGEFFLQVPRRENPRNCARSQRIGRNIGISQPRNKNLAAIFHRLRLIESYGTGIRRIYALYADCPAQPRIEVTANTFKIVLPNQNTAHAAAPLVKDSAPIITAQMKKILDYIREHGQITDEETQALLELKKTRAFTLSKQMREMGLIEVEGRGKAKYYKTRQTMDLITKENGGTTHG